MPQNRARFRKLCPHFSYRAFCGVNAALHLRCVLPGDFYFGIRVQGFPSSRFTFTSDTAQPPA